jgi:DNA-binding response OmpR family regulator
MNMNTNDVDLPLIPVPAEEALSKQEYALFTCLFTRINETLTREHLKEKVCNQGDTDWALDQLIHRLRSRLNYTSFKIETIRGHGYKLEKV